MTNMHNFSRALSAYLAGKPQNEFAAAASLNRSKVCRLLKNAITCDRETLDAVLTAIPDNHARQEIVTAYIRDYASPGALLHLKPSPESQWEGFDFRPLSPKGRAALQQLLSGNQTKVFEKVLISLAEALA